MKKNYKTILLFALTASFSGLYAEEEQLDSREISMSKTEEGCPRPGDCKPSRLELDYYKQPSDDYDYDVYTQGERDGEESEESCYKQKKRDCSRKCERKGAAKVAQE